MPDRMLTEQQVNAVLLRAAEIQSSNPTEEKGIRSTDVQRIGEELGLNPEAIRQALAELDGQAAPVAKRRFWPSAKVEETHVLPVELTDEDWHDLADELRRQIHPQGKATEVAGALEWDGPEDLKSRMNVTMRRRRGKTRLTVRGDISGGLGLLGFTGFMVGTMTALVVMKESGWDPATAWGVGLGTAAVLTGGLRALSWAADNRRRKLMKGIMDFADKLVDRREESLRDRLGEAAPLEDKAISEETRA